MKRSLILLVINWEAYRNWFSISCLNLNSKHKNDDDDTWYLLKNTTGKKRTYKNTIIVTLQIRAEREIQHRSIKNNYFFENDAICIDCGIKPVGHLSQNKNDESKKYIRSEQWITMTMNLDYGFSKNRTTLNRG